MNGFVYVIESPSSQDLLDSRTEGQALCKALALAEIPYWYSLVTDRECLGQAMGPRLVEAWKTLGGRPILHLSMHGNKEGIALTHRDDFLSWHDLRQALLPLNRVLEGGLLICMSSCFGASGCRMAMYEDDKPFFWALVGNSKSATWADSAVAYITFYHLLFKDTSIERCVAAMKEASGDSNFESILGQAAKEIGANLLQQALDRLSRRIEDAANRAQKEIEHSGRATPNPGPQADG